MNSRLISAGKAAFVALASAGFLSGTLVHAEDAAFTLIPKNVEQKTGSPMPFQTVKLSTEKPAGIKKMPADVTTALYGEFKFGPKESAHTIYVVVDDTAGRESRLFVDANGNGDLTDDAPADWKAGRTNKLAAIEFVTFSGGAMVKATFGAETEDLHVAMRRSIRVGTPPGTNEILFYSADYARTGKLDLGGKSYTALLLDPGAVGDFRGAAQTNRQAAFYLDVNNDGKFDRQHEYFKANQPFNIGGTTYELGGLTASGATVQVAKSSQTVPETLPLAILTANHEVLPFAVENTEGKPVKFPESYKGKLVLLDFWATWCGPCVGELPHLTNVYAEFHPKGFEVLGISLDREKAAEKLATFTKDHNMPWAQVYDGKYWQAAIAVQYNIRSIPHAFLVDGDTGMIITEGDSLRGNRLEGTIKKALEKKAAK